mmetsp:Transcript_7296/g.12571  ORF Transcript_7296/g.12571 Transcript_7296/m.12571 type:complete len:91 (-) Transcript_7296:1846-2118(-)
MLKWSSYSSAAVKAVPELLLAFHNRRLSSSPPALIYLHVQTVTAPLAKGMDCWTVSRPNHASFLMQLFVASATSGTPLSLVTCFADLPSC